jgi:hypothetical protein
MALPAVKLLAEETERTQQLNLQGYDEEFAGELRVFDCIRSAFGTTEDMGSQ